MSIANNSIELSNPIAEIGVIRGEVSIRHASGDQSMVKKGDVVSLGDTIVTPSNGAALMYASNGAVVTLGDATSLLLNTSFSERLNTLSSNTGSSRSSFQLFLDALEKSIAEGEDVEVLVKPTESGNSVEKIQSLSTTDQGLVVIWERNHNELIPISGYRFRLSDGSEDYFGNQIGSFFELNNEGDIFTPIVNDIFIPRALSSGDDSLLVDEDSGANIGSLFSNDSTSSGGSLHYSLQAGSHTSNGVLLLNTDGSYSYTPNDHFHGLDSFQYVVFDAVSGESAIQTVNITVNSVNDAPLAVPDDFSVDEDSPLNDTLLFNDSDIDGDSLIVSTTPVMDVNNGSLTLNADGTFTYVPDANFHGADTFVYSVSDGNGGSDQATVNITVNSVTDIPVVSGESYDALEDTPFNATLLNSLLNNDTHGDGYSLVVNTTPISDVSHGTLVINADGTFSYTPDANFHGVDSFIYQVDDGNGGTAQATATITVAGSIDLTTASEVEVTNEDVPLVSTVATGDSTISGGSLRYSLVSIPVNGVFSSAIDINTGAYTYVPNADFVGVDSFQYLVEDLSSGESSVETVSITIQSVDDLSAADDVLAVGYQSVAVGNVSTNDSSSSSGGDAALVFSQLTSPASGALTFNSDGSYSYDSTGVGDAGGLQQFTYLVIDPIAGESAVQTVNITVDPANTAPEGSDNSATIDEDSSYTMLVSDFGFSDVVENDTFTGVRIDSLPTLGALTLAGIAVTVGQVITVLSITSGDLILTPEDNGNGAPYSTFTFSVQDSADSIDITPNTFTLNVDPVSDLPVAEDDTYEVVVETPFTTTLANGVLFNDSDGDGDILTVNTTPVSNVSGGVLVLNADGTFTYTPNDGFLGSDSFTYEIDDGNGNTTQATANITVDYISNSIIGTSANDNLIGAAFSDDDIYSGGVSSGSENVQGVAGTTSEAQFAHVGSGNDRLIFDADDAYVDSASSGSGLIRIRDFTVGDVNSDTDADTLVLGDFLRAGDASFDGTAADAVRFIHFVNDKLIYIDRDGALGAAGDAARDLISGDYGGITSGASLLLEFKGVAFDATPLGNTLNTEAQIQQLMDYGFLDFA